MWPTTWRKRLGLLTGTAFVLLLWLPGITAGTVGKACFDADRSRKGQYFGCNVGIGVSNYSIIGQFDREKQGSLFARRGILRAEDGLTEAAREDFRRAIDLASGGDLVGRITELQAWAAKPKHLRRDLDRHERALTRMLGYMDSAEVPAAIRELWQQELEAAIMAGLVKAYRS